MPEKCCDRDPVLPASASVESLVQTFGGLDRPAWLVLDDERVIACNAAAARLLEANGLAGRLGDLNRSTSNTPASARVRVSDADISVMVSDVLTHQGRLLGRLVVAGACSA